LGDFGYSVEQGFKARYLNRVVSQEAGICVAIKNIRVIDKIVVQGEGTVQCKVSEGRQ
jgi:DNA-directed RNA polymerase subunit E'/Rpb7